MEKTNGSMAFEYLPRDMGHNPTRELFRVVVRLANLETRVIRYYDNEDDIKDLARVGHEVIYVTRYVLREL